MLSTLSEITAVQCRPLGGFAYPNRHDDMMTDFSQSNDNEDNEDELDDDTLAEQVLRLGLNHNVDETLWKFAFRLSPKNGRFLQVAVDEF